MTTARAFACGTVLGIAMLVALGAAQAPETAIGRYRLEVGTDASRAKAYVIDTATGTVWEERQEGFVRRKLDVTE
jgi:hypothetical protein